MELTQDQYDALCDALALPRDSDFDAVVTQAAGLVTSLSELSTMVYVGIIRPVLERNHVALPGWRA